MNNIVLITGYYRSGTSALAGFLNKSGIIINNSATPNKYNPLGFYESKDVTNFDYTVFSHLGMKWHSINRVPINWYLHPTAQKKVAELTELLTKQEAALWGIKHPHLCRLVPFYEHVITKCLPQAASNKIHNIHISRNPWISARSQMEKNGLSQSHSLLLWCIYIIDAERNTRHLPRSWVMYDQLLNSPSDLFDKIQKDLKINLHNFDQARETIQPDMNKSQALPKTFVSEDLISLVDYIWGALLRNDFNTDLWDHFRHRCDQMVSLIIDVNKSLKI